MKKRAARRPSPAPRRAAPAPPPPAAAVETPDQDRAAAYARHKERARQRQAEVTAAGVEIGPLPEVADPPRRQSCEWDFRRFCETYFPQDFRFAWSPEQLLVIQRVERTVRQGGQFALAMPRGNGKSTICEAAVLWATLYGHHRYVMLICATLDKFTDEALPSIKTALESNELLAADFPEVCYPIACLEGVIQKASKQTLNGERTCIGWKGRRIILPTVPGAPASGAIIGGGGLQAGTIRGSKLRRREGGIIRPSLVLLDDPQTDESAASHRQCDTRERLVSSAVLGMAGPAAKMSVLMPCTVIVRGDMVDRMLDREKYPEWKGHRTAMILRWPEQIEKWEEWNDLRREELRGNDDLRSADEDPAPRATAFVRAHYEELHAGAEVSWEARKRPYHVSALHQAMELYYRDPLGFFSEYQNWLLTPGSPPDPTRAEDLHLDPARLACRWSGYERLVLPPDTQWVTGFIDCHDRVLVWLLCGWAPNFSGAIIDYGTWPPATRPTWTVGTFRPTLKEQYPGTGQDGALVAGLRDLSTRLLAETPRREDGVIFSPSLLAIDTGYMGSTIKKWIAATHDPRLLPALGRIVGPNDVPFSQFRPRTGERIGEDWILRQPRSGAFKGQHLLIDTYSWKTFAARRLLAEPGDPGCVTLYGRGETAADRRRHDFLARQLAAEEAKPTKGRQPVHVWDKRPGESENHWWDCFVANCVLASLLGARLGGDATPAPADTRRRTMAERRAEARLLRERRRRST